jgi:hypothetical protein
MSSPSSSSDDVYTDDGTNDVYRTHDTDELRYKLEVAQALLEEDRIVWTREAEVIQRHSKDALQARRAVLEEEERAIESRVFALRDKVYAAGDDLDKVRGANQRVIERRDHVKSTVDQRAELLDTIKEALLQRMRACDCGDEKDSLIAEKIVYLLTQKHLHRLQLVATHEENVDLSRRLEEVKYQRRALHNAVEEAKGNIRVLVRMRPALSSDFTAPRHALRSEEGSITVDVVNNTVTINSASTGIHSHEYYRVYGPPNEDHYAKLRNGRPSSHGEVLQLQGRTSSEQQRVIFAEQIQPVLQSLFDGINVSVMAYGQTGSGKTFTIFGEAAAKTDAADDAETRHASSDAAAVEPDGLVLLDGLLPQAMRHVFELKTEIDDSEALRSHASTEGEFERERDAVVLRMSMVEVYMNDVYDLLAPAASSPAMTAPLVMSLRTGGPTTLHSAGAKCEIRALASGGAAVVGAEEVQLNSVDDALETIARGFAGRKTHKTLTNARSSRSHLLLTVTLDVLVTHPNTGQLSRRASKLMFVDLAGSERVNRSLSSGDRLKEAQYINKSLSALGDVLAALTSKKGAAAGHVPYRNSKLTHLLQPCIGGDSKTVMIACICPHVPQRHNLGETASTLAFAARARLVQNKVVINGGGAGTRDDH